MLSGSLMKGDIMFNIEKETVWRFVNGTEPVTEQNLTDWFKKVMPEMPVRQVLDEMIMSNDLFLSEGRYYTTPQKWK